MRDSEKWSGSVDRLAPACTYDQGEEKWRLKMKRWGRKTEG